MGIKMQKIWRTYTDDPKCSQSLLARSSRISSSISGSHSLQKEKYSGGGWNCKQLKHLLFQRSPQPPQTMRFEQDEQSIYHVNSTDLCLRTILGTLANHTLQYTDIFPTIFVQHDNTNNNNAHITCQSESIKWCFPCATFGTLQALWHTMIDLLLFTGRDFNDGPCMKKEDYKSLLLSPNQILITNYKTFAQMDVSGTTTILAVAFPFLSTAKSSVALLKSLNWAQAPTRHKSSQLHWRRALYFPTFWCQFMRWRLLSLTNNMLASWKGTNCVPHRCCQFFIVLFQISRTHVVYSHCYWSILPCDL